MRLLTLKPHVSSDGRQIVSWHFSNGRFGYVEGSGMDPSWCGGKNAALRHAVHTLRHDIVEKAPEYIIIRDDDIQTIWGSIPEELMRAGLPKLASGRRVFSSSGSFPTRVRRVWGNFATAFLGATHSPWGGCMAIRKDCLPRAMELWETSLFDDLVLTQEWKSVELPVDCFDNSRCGWAELWEFVIRQLVDVRLYGNRSALWFTWLMALALPAGIVWTALHTGEPLRVAAGTILAAQLIGFATGVWEPFSVVACQVLHLISVPAAFLRKQVSWKKRVYEIQLFIRGLV